MQLTITGNEKEISGVLKALAGVKTYLFQGAPSENDAGEIKPYRNYTNAPDRAYTTAELNCNGLMTDKIADPAKLADGGTTYDKLAR